MQPSLFSSAARHRRVFFILCFLLLATVIVAPFASDARRRSNSQNASGRQNATGDNEPATWGALDAKTGRADFVPGEIIVRFRNANDKPKQQIAVSSALGGRQLILNVERFDGAEIVEGLRLARVAPEDTLEAVAALNSRDDVLYAEPNFVRRLFRTSNDPRAGELWGMNKIGVRAAWDITTGSRSIVVGVIDEGIDINHQDLRDNIWRNPVEVVNGIDDDGNGFADDTNGWDFFHNDNSVYDGSAGDSATDAHGTHVAGTIGAVGDNGTGVVGVNWQVSLLPLKILGKSGESPVASSVSVTVRAYAYAKQMRDLFVSSNGARGANIRVLNNSYGGYGFSQAELDAIRALGDSSILFVAAAGNEATNNATDPVYPSEYAASNLISVGATDTGDYLPQFSNWGGNVAMFAPGSSILSTVPNNGYMSASGTSMASPHVAGAAALILAAYPNTSIKQLRGALVYGGVAVAGGYSNLRSRRLFPHNSMQIVAENDQTPPGRIKNLTAQRNTNSAYQVYYTLNWAATGDDDDTGQAAVHEIRFSEQDLSDPEKFEQARPLDGTLWLPTAAGQPQTANVFLPYRAASPGFIGIRAVDSSGNAGEIVSLPLSFDQNIGDPFTMTIGGASTTLSTGGTPLGIKGDDVVKESVLLPFPFAFYKGESPYYAESVTVSSNGTLYINSVPPRLPSGNYGDPRSTVSLLNYHRMVAPLWDDLRTDRRAEDDVYMVVPDRNRVIFRWQAVTLDFPIAPGVTRGENPVSFEVELNRDGTIQFRYGDGNRRLFPVVGVSGGAPSAYLVESHTSEQALKDLTNAPPVTFTPRRPTPLPAPDLYLTLNKSSATLMPGQEVPIEIRFANRKADQLDQAEDARVQVTLPEGLGFVSCNSNCNAPAVGASGAVTYDVGRVASGTMYSLSVTARVTATGETTLNVPVAVSNRWTDANPSDNTASFTVNTLREQFFGDAVSVAAGNYYSLALKRDGTVWSWGGVPPSRPSGNLLPAHIPGLSNIVQIAASGDFVLALKSDGTAWVFGTNNVTTTDSLPATEVARQVAGATNVRAIAASQSTYGHALLLKNDGTVWGFGRGMNGELGNGTIGNFLEPVQARDLTNVIAISAGEYFSLAVKDDGTVWGFGTNNAGQLGTGVSGSTNVPRQVVGVANVRGVAAGGGHSLFLTSDGAVWGIGMNNDGQIGNNTRTNIQMPVRMSNITNARSISAGRNHSLVLQADGSVWACGSDGRGSTDGSTTRLAPTQVAGINGAVSVSAGSRGATDSFSIVALGDGTLRAWGDNAYGQLGDGTNSFRTAPVRVSGLQAVATPRITPDVGYNTTIERPTDVRLYCDTPDATIRYTLDGTEPNPSSPTIASGASLRIDRTLTLRAQAVKAGMVNSRILSVQFYFYVPPPARIHFARSSSSIVEYPGVVPIAVIREGTTYNTVTVDYSTDDPAQLFNCDPSSAGHPTGTASARCDYATTVGTLRFAPNETMKNIFVPLTDDGFVEQPETFTVTLRNPTGGEITGSPTATVTITDNDTQAPATNPVNNSDTFIRQHYIDFLGRNPADSETGVWTQALAGCAPGNLNCDRTWISGVGFFQSQEFQQKGFFVYRLYKATRGVVPMYNEFIPDMVRLGGTSDSDKQAFVDYWMQKPSYTETYGALSNSEFVQMLQTRSGVSFSDAAQIVAALDSGASDRRTVLLNLIESAELRTREFNEAWVVMQYFGYLRRDGAPAEYADWKRVLDRNPADYRTMTEGFINSIEYRNRFGNPNR